MRDRWFAGEAVRNYGDVIPSSIKGVHNTVIKQPVGVCGISELPQGQSSIGTAADLVCGASHTVEFPECYVSASFYHLEIRIAVLT